MIRKEFLTQSFSRKRDAVKVFAGFQRMCDNEELPYKLFMRDDKTRRKPIRGRLQVQVDGFFYYVELFKQ